MVAMMTWGSTTYLVVPLVVGLGLLILILFLRWAYSPKKTSLIQRPTSAGNKDDYGMLVPIGNPANYVEGEKLRQELLDNKIKATLAFTLDGPKLMVWPIDESKARNLLRGRV
jgi:hypothetical protein